MNPFEQLVCKEVWAEYKLGQVLQLDSSLHLQAKKINQKKKSYHILLQMISQTLIPAVWWGKDISNSMETHWCHRLLAYACTHTHASSQIDRKSACTHTHTVTNKHRSMQKTQMSAAFFICSAIILLSFFSLFICIFSSQSFLALAPDCNKQKWPPILTSQTWPMVVQFSTAWIRTVQLLGLAWLWTVLACLSLRPG